MLLKSSICKTKVMTDDWLKYLSGEVTDPMGEWLTLRLKKITSSKVVVLLGDSLKTKGAVSYMEQKVGEMLSGQSDEDKFETEHTIWGVTYEPPMLRRFQQEKQAEFFVTNTMIHAEGTMFSSTPDGIWIHAENSDGLSYNVSTVEGKCPKKYSRYNELYRLNAPEELQKAEPKYFWQVIDQMDNAGAAKGYFAIHHPLYPPECDFKSMEFRLADKFIWDSKIKLVKRKQQAEEIINDLYNKMVGK